MYFSLHPDTNQGTRTLTISKLQAEKELTQARRALSNILEQPKDSYEWASRVAKARINVSFWQDMIKKVSEQLQDCGNTTQLVLK